MAQKKAYLTRKRLEELKAELHILRTSKRHEVADRILRATGLGGTEDNADYNDAKNDQAFIEGRILTMDNIVHNAVIIPERKHKSEKVDLGAKVTVKEESGRVAKYVIVGSTEANPKAGLISNESPVGQALLGKKAGDSVEVKIPAGVLKLTVKDVK
ncbi:MAG: transcription elongation factor GreA [Dehalococcoidia bacterium]